MAILFSGACSHMTGSPEDPYLWLEDIYSDTSLNWARKHNEKTLGLLTARPIYKEIEPKIREILTAKDRIPFPNHRQQYVYNFWQDAEHVKGLWRRTGFTDYVNPNPNWEILLDIDALSRAENESWVFHGAQCLPPEERRCLIQLSRGGKDAAIYREFDLDQKVFLPDGFSLPEAKSDMFWIDLNTVFVSTDFGPGSLTDSGYPRIVKKWKRGTLLAEAETLLEGQISDMGVYGWTSHRPEGNLSFISRRKSFYESENFMLEKDGTLHKLPFPDSANLENVFHGYAMAILRFPWQLGARTIPEGALVSLSLSPDRLAEPDRAVEVVYVPSERASIQHLAVTKNFMVLDTLDNVKGRLLRVQKSKNGWSTETLPFPDNGEIGVVSVDAFDDRYFAQFQSFLVPTSLYLGDLQSQQKPHVVRQLPARFDASTMVTEQRTAISHDGTNVPYFI
ncbi:MAG: S9 family peptidase, partial [Bdellovibrionota bacterium]